MKIILFLLLITNLMAQPGPIQTQEAGISNYQIQATAPTTTPVAGKKYLYNENSQLKTKDNLANIERVNKNYDNYIPNFDIEEGLLPYVFTAARAVLNTATPLEGLRSIDFDGTALNDFVETPLITLPRVLMGQTCMVKINIKGGDANLQLQVVNGAGTVIGLKQLAVTADSSPYFITFNCPTQALITATPALGQLKIKVTQSTATNAALATLDSFYLGRFESNTMTVQGQIEEYWGRNGVKATANAVLHFPNVIKNTISYCGAIVSDATNGFIYTAKNPCLISFSAGFKSSGVTASGIVVALNPTVISESTSVPQGEWIAATIGSANSNIPVAGSVITKVGDIIRPIGRNDAPIATNPDSFLTLTATPLPQLATVVSTNQMRAGWLGQRTWQQAGCQWLRSSATPGSMGIVAGCAGATNSGYVIPDAVTDGQLPKVTLSKLPKGKITVKAYGIMGPNTAVASTLVDYSLALNGAIIPNNKNSIGIGASSSLYIPFISWTFNNSTELINPNIEIFGSSGNANQIVINGTPAYPFNIVVSYEPDLSDSYSIPELFAVLPPQVINSSGKVWRTESCYITNNGTAAMASSSCGTFVQSVSRTSLGNVTVNFLPGIFTSKPMCSCLAMGGITCQYNSIVTTAQAEFRTNNPGINSYDTNFDITCNGFTN